MLDWCSTLSTKNSYMADGVRVQNVAGAGPPPPAAAAAGLMLKPHQTVVGNAKNGFAVYSCASPLYQQMTMPVNPAQCYPLTSQCLPSSDT